MISEDLTKLRLRKNYYVADGKESIGMNKKFIKFLFLLTIILALFPDMVYAVYTPRQIVSKFSVTSGEALTIGHVVMLKDADGEAYKADSDDSNLRPAIGIVGTTAANATTVAIITEGIVGGFSSLQEGLPVYLSTTAAGVTQTAPSYAQKIGMAISTTEIEFDFEQTTNDITSLGTLTGSSPVVVEGTADAYETTVTFGDATADRTITVPDETGYLLLWSNKNTQDVDIIYEGATADAYETTVTVTDPTADRTITIPNMSGAPILSSLTTNAADAANSVTGTTNGFLFECATANDYEITVSPADATADRTFTIPDATTGTVLISSINTHSATGNITENECWGGIVTNNGSVEAIVLTLPVAVAGMRATIYLDTAQDVDINPQNGTQILALTNAAGDAISSAATIGNMVTLVALSSTAWASISISGTWTDVN